MYLENTIKNNPKLIQTAVKLHQSGQIPANTFLIDIDTVKLNTQYMKKEADQYGIKLYMMTKQFNRNPLVSWAIAKAGIPSAVAVDTQCARDLNRYKISVGHMGHLVPIPKSEIEDMLDMDPEVITVFGVEKAKQISDVALKKDKVQKILLRIRDIDDFIWPNEDGGFLLSEVEDAYSKIINLKGVEITGVSSFPMFLYSEKTGKGEPTPNFWSAMKAAEMLKKLGANIEQINSPGDTSTKMIKVIADNGGTHGEPGCAFLGHTPWGLYEEIPEKPCMIYVNEITHFYGSKAYIPGGGFYACYVTGGMEGFYFDFRKQHNGWTPNALVGNLPENIFDNKVPVVKETFLGVTHNATDYISELYPKPGSNLKVGDTVIYGFRTQVFVTRAFVAVVKGVQSDNPELLGIFDRSNNLLNERLYPVKNSEENVEEIFKKI